MCIVRCDTLLSDTWHKETCELVGLVHHTPIALALTPRNYIYVESSNEIIETVYFPTMRKYAETIPIFKHYPDPAALLFVWHKSSTTIL